MPLSLSQLTSGQSAPQIDTNFDMTKPMTAPQQAPGFLSGVTSSLSQSGQGCHEFSVLRLLCVPR